MQLCISILLTIFLISLMYVLCHSDEKHYQFKNYLKVVTLFYSVSVEGEFYSDLPKNSFSAWILVWISGYKVLLIVQSRRGKIYVKKKWMLWQSFVDLRNHLIRRRISNGLLRQTMRLSCYLNDSNSGQYLWRMFKFPNSADSILICLNEVLNFCIYFAEYS